MKSISYIFVTVCAVLIVFTGVLAVSCSKDACKTVVCLNKGNCSGGACSCPTGWTGTSCQTSVFIGNWNGRDVCDSSGIFTMSVGIDASTQTTGKYIITNPHGYAGQVSGTLSTDGKTITIATQPIGPVYFSGHLYLNTNTALGFSYTTTDTGTVAKSENCSGNYQKQ